MKNVIKLLSLGLILVSCNNLPDNPDATESAANKEIEELQVEIMTVHDSAMAKMATLSTLQRRLKEQWQTTRDSLPYMDMHRNLQHYHDDMMDWMRNYEVPENSEGPEAREYLLEEKRAIEAIDAEMDKGIEEARFLLENPELGGDINPEEEGEISKQRKN